MATGKASRAVFKTITSDISIGFLPFGGFST
jgi:hypothetical protein